MTPKKEYLQDNYVHKFTNTGCDVTVLFRTKAYAEAWRKCLNLLSAMYLRGQKIKKYTKSQTEEVVSFTELKHLKELELKPHILKH